MKYRESQKDKNLRQWFTKDFSRALLRRIILKEGTLRGLNALDISFDYPIVAIAGKNGAGKSTILALACCAFHNNPGGFKLTKRKNPYYTFSDHFIQFQDEVPPAGIEIQYFIAHNNWKKSQHFPDGIGLGYQSRRKLKGGKWSDYDRRVKRNVVFLGIERIVPHSERSQSKSYAKVFKDAKSKGWEIKVKDAVGFVLNRVYEKFQYLEYSKYSLPVVQVNGVIYSGFNMGAGENALFEIFSTLYSAGDGALLVMDEVELGLHAEAQRRFIERLKEVCLELHTQVICTTHSKEIFDCLPNDARFYIESVNGKTKISDGVSSDFAFAKLSAITGLELELYVEDDVAKSIVLASLPASIRSRCTIRVIGSAAALSRQLAAQYLRERDTRILAVFDGDQRNKENDNLKYAMNMAEKTKPDFPDWFKDRIAYLPGDTWPEAWLLQRANELLDPLSAILGTDTDSLAGILEYGLQAGKHQEFYEVSKQLGLEQQQSLQYFTTVVCQETVDELSHISKKIEVILAS